MVTYLRINGVVMPAPQTFKIQKADLDSEKTTRSETGFLKRDRIRANVYKIECSWLIQEADLQKLNMYLSLKEFQAEFYDGTTGNYTICLMYAGDRTSELLLPKNNPSDNWWSFSCNLIEY